MHQSQGNEDERRHESLSQNEAISQLSIGSHAELGPASITQHAQHMRPMVSFQGHPKLIHGRTYCHDAWGQLVREGGDQQALTQHDMAETLALTTRLRMLCTL